MASPKGDDHSVSTSERSRDGVAAGSVVSGLVRTVRDRIVSTARASTLYQWLTTEPDPAVIVIDLRETRTVGPILALLDRLIEWATPYWRQSRLHDGVIALERAGERVAATRAGQLLARLLVPPDPPTDDERRE
jgi:hypothetical protein